MNEEFEKQDPMTEQDPQQSAQPAQEPDHTQYEAPRYTPQEQTATKKKKKKVGGVIALILVFAILGGLGGSYLTKLYFDRFRPEAAVGDEGPAEPVFEEVAMPKIKTVVGDKSLTPADVYEQNVDSVVGIVTEMTTTNIFGQISSAVCGGSGFIFTEDGYIVTNAHVVGGAKSVRVTLHNGDEYDAKIVGTYSANDVALLKIEASGLHAVTIGKSSDLVVGEQVAAIGNPLFELTYSMTVGYVSSLSRSLNIDGTPMNVLQTDVAINSGNSGGPLFDMNGNVIGITNAKRSGQTSSGASIEGISFSIPIDDVVDILRELAVNGRVNGLPYLGVEFRNLDSSIASVYKLPVGPYVTEIIPGEAAEKAGMQVGDIVLKFNDTEVATRSDVVLALQKFRAGDTVTLTVYRSGTEITLDVVLGERPPEDEQEQTTEQLPPQQLPQQNNGQTPDFGFPFNFFFGY
ncbi:MAG: trypsin-like peptidase domain-containing protein [Oscillospiraceae bacterium]|nr:trypsin-like peptidase domain-containing protein [Oscillospiraceae bacterium]